MKATGVVRKIDDLGRVVVPIEIRRTMGWEDNQAIEFFAEGENIMLRAYRPGCSVCGSLELGGDIEVRGKRYCRDCAAEIAGAVR